MKKMKAYLNGKDIDPDFGHFFDGGSVCGDGKEAGYINGTLVEFQWSGDSNVLNVRAIGDTLQWDDSVARIIETFKETITEDSDYTVAYQVPSSDRCRCLTVYFYWKDPSKMIEDVLSTISEEAQYLTNRIGTDTDISDLRESVDNISTSLTKAFDMLARMRSEE